MRKRMKKLLVATTIIGLNSFVPVSINAQTATETGTYQVNGQEFDYYESIYPQTNFTLVEGESIRDRIQLDEETLFASIDDALYVTNPGDDFVYVNDVTGATSYRDLTTFAWLYLVYDNGDMEIVSPAVASPELTDTFSIAELVEAQYQDVIYKTNGSFLSKLTDDMYEMYNFTKTFSPSIIADVYADIRRAEVLQQEDPDNAEIQDFIDLMYNEYDLLVERYDISLSENPELRVELLEGVEESDEMTEKSDFVLDQFALLPLDFQQRLGRFGFMTHEDINNIIEVGDFDLNGMAYPTREIHFSEEYDMEPVIIYHEMGHIIDYSSRIYRDPSLEEYQSFSQSEEWLAIHDEEWAEEGSYYDKPIESFAQGFAGYWVKEILGEELTDFGYEDTDITDRPATEAYFEELFATLGVQ